jgi:hypothetical protein
MLTPEQVEEFNSLRNQFTRYCYVATQGATFFRPNDLINHAFLHLNTDYKYVKNVKLSAILEIRREIIRERIRNEKKPLLLNVFSNELPEDNHWYNKGNPDNYKGSILSSIGYDYEQIQKLIDSYKTKDKQSVEIIMLLAEGYKAQEIREKLKLSDDDYKLKVNKIRGYLKKRLTPGQSFRTNIVCSFENSGRYLKRTHYKEEIEKGLKENKSVVQIARELGIGRYTVYYHYNRWTLKK